MLYIGKWRYMFLDNKQCSDDIDVNRSFFQIGGDGGSLGFMVLNAMSNNISAISWRSG